MEQDEVFRALADPSRRMLLDLLRKQDGQSLSELEAHLPMTRFGVMKHLRLLEDAGLITTEKVGRSKHHYLNPVPIQSVYDRWVRKYSQPVAERLTDLKHILESQMNDTITHRYQIYIQTNRETVWDALLNNDIIPSYYFGLNMQTDGKAGSHYEMSNPDIMMIDGEILEIDPPSKLVQTFNAHWQPEAQALGTSKVTWLLEQEGDACKLTLVHEELKNLPFAEGIVDGWSRILSSLKTILETGKPFSFGM